MNVPASWEQADGFMHPPLMGIGDSMINGMQSATITGRHARSGVVPWIAKALGVHEIRIPDYCQRPLLVDVEALLRTERGGPAALVELIKRKDEVLDEIRANALTWIAETLGEQSPPEDAPLFHDVLGLAGAEVDDVATTTYGEWTERVRRFREVVVTERNPLRWSDGEPAFFARLHMALNAAYLINPSRMEDEALGDLTLFDIVHMRAPRILIADMGANHGLFEYTLNGRPDRGAVRMRKFETLLPRLASQFAKLPSSVQHVVFWMYPLPSQVPNLMPCVKRGQHEYDTKLVAHGILSDYTAALPLENAFHDIDHVKIRNANILARQISAKARNLLAQARPSLQFLDLGVALEQYDYKHDRNRKVVVEASNAASGKRTVYTNLAIGPSPILLEDRQGGLASLDHHHPSTIGYQLLAKEVLKLLEKKGVTIGNDLPLSDKGDDLLTELPKAYDEVIKVWKKLGPLLWRLMADNEAKPQLRNMAETVDGTAVDQLTERQVADETARGSTLAVGMIAKTAW